MRIAYVSTDPGIPVFGCKGASVHVQEMVRAFLAKGADITLFSPCLEGDVPRDLEGIGLHPLPSIPKGCADERTNKQIALNTHIAKALDDEGPFDLIYERHALFAHAAMEYANEHGIESVLEVNAPLIDEQARHRSIVRIDEAILSACNAFLAAKNIVAVSPEVATYAKGLCAPAARTRVEPNAVNPSRFRKPASFGGPFRVGFLGTLKPWHDVALIIKAFALLKQDVPDAELLIVGDGPERAILARQAEAAGVIGSVQFTGAVPAAKVPFWLAKMHVGLATYRKDDPFYFSPLKLFEYMAAGLPSVVSQVGDLADMIQEGQTGLSVPPNDPDALADVLRSLARDPDLTRKMGSTARQHVLATQTWDHVAARVLSRADLAPQQRRAVV